MRQAARLLILAVALPAFAVPEDHEGRAMVQEAQRLIAAYHAGQPPSHALLRVVCFVPADREPLPAYAERLDRVMNDVSGFYRDGLRRFGLETAGLPLERKDGKLVLHLVRGKSPAGEYHFESGDRTASEIRQALKGTVDMEREHVLVFYALCRQEPDGRYVFDAPYYGGGSQRGGLCHAADCELLDPLLLTETKKKIVYTEHYYPRVEERVARFNTKYLGGAAHELGHAFGLPHDDGSGPEQGFGSSLMGGGNLAYRQETWGRGPPAYLARASALQLASHPLFTGSDRGRWDDAGRGFETLSFGTNGGALTIRGTVAGAVPPYGAIAYAWPTNQATDHRARTFPVVLKEGAFTLALEGLRPDTYHLKLASLHANGATTVQSFGLRFDAAGAPDAAALNAAWIVNRAEQAVLHAEPQAREWLNDAALAAAPTAEAGRQLRLLRSILDPAAPFDPAAVAGDSAWLSDAAWTEAKVGWGGIARNHFWFDAQFQSGAFLTLGGRFYDKGLYAHAPARHVFALDGKWKTFSAVVGLRDGAHAQGSAVFTVRGDGRELHRSRMLRVGEQESVSVDIAGVKKLTLETEGGEGHNHNSWAIWVEPKVSR